ncbi:MAG: hypothetical protein ABI769_14780 [Pseudomonadota bacterium]
MNSPTTITPIVPAPWPMTPLAGRQRIAARVFKSALLINIALTTFCVVAYFTGFGDSIAGMRTLNARAVGQVLFGILFFNVLWGTVWYGIKNLLLKSVAGFSKEERRAAFSSRMKEPFEVNTLLARHSERRIRIVDMIGRRGRFMTLGLAGFYYLYTQVAANHPAGFATAFLKNNLLDGVITGWIFVALFYVSNFLSATIYGPQSRVMDGTLARANCLLIITLWSLFKFILVPIGTQMATLYTPQQFAAVFALIWGSYMICDTLAEVAGSIYGRQSIRVRGIGDVNRKSIAGTLAGFAGSLVFCTAIVWANELPPSFFALAAAISLSNTLLELFSPRGTDDFTMATGNALLCWAFGAWVLA